MIALGVSACGSTAPPAATADTREIGQDELAGYLEDQAVPEPASRENVARVLTEHIWVDIFEEDLAERGVAVPTDEEIRGELGAEPSPDALLPQDRILPLIRRIATDESGLSPDSPVEEVAELVDPSQLPVCSAHVLVATEDEALDVLARLDAGEDFADLASELSLDEGSAADGGSLGCMAPASFVPEFRDALVGLADGEVSVVVETQFGFHVLLREGVDFEQTTSEVLFDTYAGDLAIELLRSSDVEVLERLGEWNPESDPPQVIVRL